MADNYVPKEGDVVVAEFEVSRKVRFGETRKQLRQVFGAVERVTPTRVLIQTLKTSFFGFSKHDVWVPRESARAATPKQRAKWNKAIAECADLVRAIRDAHVSEARS